MGIDHGVANLERHVTGTPSVAIKGNTRIGALEWRFRRSGHISGLDNNNANVLRRGRGTRYSQVGAALRGKGNAYVTGS
ncbi:hypothetical protein FE156_13195 [Streptomyces albidoflavus]|uniref:Uncharacterized protein n=1 Tax=Streptomyces odorifer TaxID=53450 RepID=A0A7Y6F3E9_9ACTN|nr:hypothetical protein [Streptomyces odorifer]NUV35755.1 hypothetical protein [Streptomyces sp. KAI-27]NUV48493.1 hypothetical protein [Streptomyces sp. CAI-78]QDD62321.1 hypothetical protein FE156_13195 [Streptomyces albidoflavus]